MRIVNKNIGLSGVTNAGSIGPDTSKGPITRALEMHSPDFGGHFLINHYPKNPVGRRYIVTIHVNQGVFTAQGESLSEAVGQLYDAHPELFPF